MRFNNKNVILPEHWTQPGPANDELWYTSSDGNIVTPHLVSSLPTIISNTYVDGKGVIKFTTDVTSIGGSAFSDCSSLTSITIPNSVTSIGGYVFYNCRSLTSVTIPNGVLSIGERGFSYCTSLTSVTIPNSVTSIEYYAFQLCTSLTSVTIPNSVTSIEERSFSGCTSLTSISYTGTIAQYNAITKGTNWHYNVPTAVVHCTDGDVAI